MSTPRVRPIQEGDRGAWAPLWDGYNAFYGRLGASALSPAVTACTWQRFFDPAEPVFALVAELDGRVVGLAHYLFHRNTTRIEPVCYLQDLFVSEPARGRGVAEALMHAVFERARVEGVKRVYWHTHSTNAKARRLYDRVGKDSGFIVYANEV